MELENFSAYHGGEWKGRTLSHADDCRTGDFWRPSFGTNSEFAPLQEVLLFSVGTNYPEIACPDDVQFLRPVDREKLRNELDALAGAYQSHGVRVLRISENAFANVSPNLVFCRDLFFLTPYGAILARMASQIRAGEEKWAQAALAKEGIPVLRTITGTGVFEGADALWLTPKLLLVGIGNRTNQDGFRQIQSAMNEFGVECIPVPLPKSVQHLLGILQLAAPNKAFIRHEKAPNSLLDLLAKYQIHSIGVAESDEIREKQALNFVCLDENKILMAKDCPQTKQLFLEHGLKIAAEVEISQLISAAGGIACATGIVSRKLRFSSN